MHQHIHMYTNLELIGWIQSLSVGFTPKEQARPKIGMRNVPHLDLCGENPSHLLLGRFHDNAWVQLFRGLSLDTPNHWKAGHLPQRTLSSEPCVILRLQNYFILANTHIYPHLDQLFSFSPKQCLVLPTAALKLCPHFHSKIGEGSVIYTSYTPYFLSVLSWKNSTQCTSVQCCRLLEPHLMRFKLILPQSQIQPPLLCSTVLTELSLRPFTAAPQQHPLLETCMLMHVNPYWRTNMHGAVLQQAVVCYRNCASCWPPSS